MPAPVTPQEFLDVVPSANTGICEKFLKVFLRLPVLVYRLVSWMFNADGSFSDEAKAELGSGTGTVTLSAPVNVSASDGTFTDKVTVTWSPVSGAAYYEIYRSLTNDSAEATLLSSPTATSFDDVTGEADRSYWYFVRAKNTANTSPFSTGDSGFTDTTGGGGGGAAFSNNYTSSGGVVIPSGVSTVEAQILAGGGGGGAGSYPVLTGQNFINGGGGGAGGFRHVKNIPVTAGDVLSWVIGPAGAGGAYTSTGLSGQDGGDISLYKNDVLIASVLGGEGGAAGGANSSNGAFGDGGSSGSNTIGSAFASNNGADGTSGTFTSGLHAGGVGGDSGVDGFGSGGNGGTMALAGSAGELPNLIISWPTT